MTKSDATAYLPERSRVIFMLSSAEWEYLRTVTIKLVRLLRKAAKGKSKYGLCYCAGLVTEIPSTYLQLLRHFAELYLECDHMENGYWFISYSAAETSPEFYQPRIEFLEYVLRLCKSK